MAYLLSRNDLDVHAVNTLHPSRDPVIFEILYFAAVNEKIANYLPRLLSTGDKRGIYTLTHL